MDAIDELYRQVTSGEKPPPGDLRTRRILLHKAFELARDGDLDTRAEALELTARIGDRDGLEATATFLEDDAPELRKRALQIGIEAGQDGRFVIREAARSPHRALAVEAIHVLLESRDRSATRTMRDLLTSPMAEVRAGAVRLLGHVAGPAVLREVEPLLDDADAEVRTQAARAHARLLGEDPGPTPGAAPERTARPPSSAPPPAPPISAPPPPADGALPPPPPAEADDLAALRSATTTSNRSLNDEDELPTATPNRELPAPIERPAAGGLWEPEPAAPLPTPLPGEALALVRLLGKVGFRDRPMVLDALRKVQKSELGAVVSGYRPGGDQARGCGIAIAAGSMGNPRWVSALRSMLKDPDPNVRSCVLIALAGLAGPSLLPQIGAQASAPEAEVRAASAYALGQAAARLGVASLADRYLTALEADADTEVVAAARAARAVLSES